MGRLGFYLRTRRDMGHLLCCTRSYSVIINCSQIKLTFWSFLVTNPSFSAYQRLLSKIKNQMLKELNESDRIPGGNVQAMFQVRTLPNLTNQSEEESQTGSSLHSLSRCRCSLTCWVPSALFVVAQCSSICRFLYHQWLFLSSVNYYLYGTNIYLVLKYNFTVKHH